MCEPCTTDALLEAVRELRVAEPDLGFKPLLAKLQAQQPDLGAATKEVREALIALKAESEAAKAAAAQPAANGGVPPAADEGNVPPSVAVSLACVGCGRLPSEMEAAELREAATHYERAAALCHAPVVKASYAGLADWCRSQAEAM